MAHQSDVLCCGDEQYDRISCQANSVLCYPGCRGVAKFEQYCAEHDVAEVSFEVLSKLYEDPNNLDALPTDKLKLLARAIIQQTMDERCVLLAAAEGTSCSCSPCSTVETILIQSSSWHTFIPAWHIFTPQPAML